MINMKVFITSFWMMDRGKMGKRCKKCKVPLEGFLYWLIASKVFGLRPSTKDPELCNKCEDMKETAWPTQTR